MTPGLARIKRAVRRAVELCGGVDGAAATADRKRSVAGDWMNLNHAAFPPADCAQALDEACVAMGHVPPILSAQASELGCVLIRLPEPGAGDDALTASLIEASAEFGDVAAELRDATRDGHVDARERERIVVQVDEAIASLVRMRALAAGDQCVVREVRQGASTLRQAQGEREG